MKKKEKTRPPKNYMKRFRTWIKSNLYEILYSLLIIGLWIYIIINWNKCISMKFFEQFDGNNILFLVGIVLIILFFYDVEAKDFKFKRKKYEIMNKEFQSADVNYQRNQLNISSAQIPKTENEGDSNNEQSRKTDSN